VIWSQNAKDITNIRKQKRIKEREKKKRKGFGPEQSGLAQQPSPTNPTPNRFPSLSLTPRAHLSYLSPTLEPSLRLSLEPSYPRSLTPSLSRDQMAPESFPLYSRTPPLPFPLFLCTQITIVPENFIAGVCRQQRRPSSSSTCRGTPEIPLLHHCSPLSQTHPLAPLACLYSQQIVAGSSIRSA
jgi:hypothetical protein